MYKQQVPYHDIPAPNEKNKQRLNKVTEVIKEKIKNSEEGMIPFNEFMQLALYDHPESYYASGNNIFGAAGDFITAPTLGHLFAQSLTTFIENAIEGVCDFIEWGPGNGQLAHHLLSFLPEKINSYILIENSAALVAEQQKLLKDHAAFEICRWCSERPEVRHSSPSSRSFAEGSRGSHQRKNSLPQSNDSPVIPRSGPESQGFFRQRDLLDSAAKPRDDERAVRPQIFLLNEVLDALPVQCFQVEQDTVLERTVGLVHDQFVWQTREIGTPAILEKCLSLKNMYQLTPGHYFEYNFSLEEFLKDIFIDFERGVICFIDYGDAESLLLRPERQRGTLMSHYQHLAIDDPFLYPGLQDLTAHVNFSQVAKIAKKYQLDIDYFNTQAAFLLAHDLTSHLAAAMQGATLQQQAQLTNEVNELTHPAAMGETFKVLVLTKNVSLTDHFSDLRDKMYQL